MKKIILILSAIILIVIIGGVLWLLNQDISTEEEPSDEISSFLENLEQETGINFSDIQTVQFDWFIEKDQEIDTIAITGKGFETKEISNEKASQAESFFTNNGFEIDMYNIAAGTVAGLTGYKKDQTVCIVIRGVSGYQEADEQWDPSGITTSDVEIKCGITEESLEPVVSTEEEIKKLFAQKYNTKVSAVVLNISQETENHVRGMVQILDETAEAKPENSGLFLAAKVDNIWQLAFDGQGVISCEEMEEYDFPMEMIEDCSKTQTIETEKDNTFIIVLDANPTTGYNWEIEIDADYLELTNKEYAPPVEELVGAGGQETFEFLALKQGETEITFSYLRSWEEGIPPIQKKVYTITIK